MRLTCTPKVSSLPQSANCRINSERKSRLFPFSGVAPALSVSPISRERGSPANYHRSHQAQPKSKLTHTHAHAHTEIYLRESSHPLVHSQNAHSDQGCKWTPGAQSKEYVGSGDPLTCAIISVPPEPALPADRQDLVSEIGSRYSDMGKGGPKH